MLLAKNFTITESSFQLCSGDSISISHSSKFQILNSSFKGSEAQLLGIIESGEFIIDNNFFHPYVSNVYDDNPNSIYIRASQHLIISRNSFNHTIFPAQIVNDKCISVAYSTNITIFENNLRSDFFGLESYHSNTISISNNTFSNSRFGLLLKYTVGSTVMKNNFTDHYNALYLQSSTNLTISFNNFYLKLSEGQVAINYASNCVNVTEFNNTVHDASLILNHLFKMDGFCELDKLDFTISLRKPLSRIYVACYTPDFLEGNYWIKFRYEQHI
jgi:hypothetical protein